MDRRPHSVWVPPDERRYGSYCPATSYSGYGGHPGQYWDQSNPQGRNWVRPPTHVWHGGNGMGYHGGPPRPADYYGGQPQRCPAQQGPAANYRGQQRPRQQGGHAWAQHNRMNTSQPGKTEKAAGRGTSDKQADKQPSPSPPTAAPSVQVEAGSEEDKKKKRRCKRKKKKEDDSTHAEGQQEQKEEPEDAPAATPDDIEANPTETHEGNDLQKYEPKPKEKATPNSTDETSKFSKEPEQKSNAQEADVSGTKWEEETAHGDVSGEDASAATPDDTALNSKETTEGNFKKNDEPMPKEKATSDSPDETSTFPNETEQKSNVQEANVPGSNGVEEKAYGDDVSVADTAGANEKVINSDEQHQENGEERINTEAGTDVAVNERNDVQRASTDGQENTADIDASGDMNVTGNEMKKKHRKKKKRNWTIDNVLNTLLCRKALTYKWHAELAYLELEKMDGGQDTDGQFDEQSGWKGNTEALPFDIGKVWEKTRTRLLKRDLKFFKGTSF